MAARRNASAASRSKAPSPGGTQRAAKRSSSTKAVTGISGSDADEPSKQAMADDDADEPPTKRSKYFGKSTPTRPSDSPSKRSAARTPGSATRTGARRAAASRVTYKDPTTEESSASEDEDSGGSEFGAESAASPSGEESALATEQEEEGTDEDAERTPRAKSRALGTAKRSAGKGTTATPTKAGKRRAKPAEDEEYEDEEGWKAGTQRVVAKLVQAPKTGHVPAGQISVNTFDFLSQLRKPECNDREWFATHDPVFRYAEANWRSFVDTMVPLLMEDGDDTLPFLPAKDLVYRIYRDVRFSNDKTPYKTNFSASFSRTGRKGRWAGYHIVISPGNRSWVAGGKWAPEKDDLSVIRHHLINRPKLLKEVISEPNFVKMFGPPKKDGRGKGKRCSLWGGEDELKVAPKMPGVDKTHKEIDFLKLRSFFVSRAFTDEQVLSPNFKNEVLKTVQVMRPLVELLNELMVPTPVSDGDGDDQEQEQEQEQDQAGDANGDEDGEGGEDGEDGNENQDGEEDGE